MNLGIKIMLFKLKVLIKKNYVRQLEIKHFKGYKRKPVHNDEFNIWEDEQEWGAE